MPKQFNVFDEWGNKVGEYTPTGGSAGDGLIMVIALFFLWTVGFLIYTLFRLIGQGIKEAKLGNWNKAISYLAVPVILTIAMFTIVIVTAVVEPAVKQRQYENVLENVRLANLNPNPIQIDVGDRNFTRGEVCVLNAGYCEVSGDYSLGFNTLFRKYQIKNNTDLNFKPVDIDYTCVIEGWDKLPYTYTLKPKQTMTLYCGIQHRGVDSCWDIRLFIVGTGSSFKEFKYCY